MQKRFRDQERQNFAIPSNVSHDESIKHSSKWIGCQNWLGKVLRMFLSRLHWLLKIMWTLDVCTQCKTTSSYTPWLTLLCDLHYLWLTLQYFEAWSWSPEAWWKSKLFCLRYNVVSRDSSMQLNIHIDKKQRIKKLFRPKSDLHYTYFSQLFSENCSIV